MDKKTYQVIAFSFVLAVMVIYLGYRFGTEEEITPCSPGGFPSRCYQVTQKMCDAIWIPAAKTCDDFIKKASLPPGRLTGPIAMRCQSAILDNAFVGSRKATPECERMFAELKEWESRNDFK